MFSSLKQSIAVVLLCVFAWSCSGLSLGMIGHELMPMEAVHTVEDMAAMHGCCGTDTQETQSTETSATTHHTPIIAPLPFFDAFVGFLFLSLFFIFHIPIGVSVDTRLRLYSRRWKERWSYFALYIVRLFSQGILHSKTW